MKRTKLFNFSRYFLLASLVLCIVFPLVEVDAIYPKQLENINTTIAFESISKEVKLFEEVIDTETQNSAIPLNPLWIIYVLVSCLFLFRFGKNLVSILSLTKGEYNVHESLNVILIEKDITPYSFFNFLFLNKVQYERGGISKYVYRHENIHFVQKHSFDLLFVELIICFFWFNPFLWLYKKAIKENHEYLVDQKIVDSEYNSKEYLNEIITSIRNVEQSIFASGFSYLKIKNRINMIGKPHAKPLVKISTIVATVVLFGIVLTLNSFKSIVYEPFVVIVDAGHGGKDPGFHGNEILEKEVCLSICRKIAALSTTGEVEIILTRANDEFISLQKRVDFAKEKKVDLMLSIHSDGNDNPEFATGVMAFYSDNQKSKEYSEILIKKGLGDLKSTNVNKPANFMVLRDLNCPGVLLTMGNLNNENDLEILRSPEKQNEIAEDIYDRLMKLRKLK